MTLAQSIDTINKLVKLYIDAKCNGATRLEDPLLRPVIIDYSSSDLFLILDSITVTTSIEIQSTSEDTIKQHNELRATTNAAAKEFCLSMALSLIADGILEEIRASLSNPQMTAKTTYKGLEIDAHVLPSIEKLALLLDVIIHINADIPSKKAFYSVLRTVLESLLSISTEAIGVFWFYMESRIETISVKMFNAKETLDRIALLGTCNHLTDNYYDRDSRGKYHSYTKDTFNDVFQARVRTFVSTLFNFDDATGLNKLLVLANRQIEEPPLAATKSSDGHLLREIFSFQRLLRDPYTFLKNHGQLSSQVESMSRLSAYFLDEESKYAKIHPTRDYFEVDSENKVHPPAYDVSSVFAPEHYWLSGFSETKSDEGFEKTFKEDTKVALKRFDQSSFRKLLLIQIYLVSCFFLELQASRKEAAIKSSKNQTNAKHLIDETVPDYLASKFQKIKRDTIRQVRTWNSPLLYVLQTVAHSEEYWWSWLIDGRQKGGSVLITDEQFNAQDISIVKEKFENVTPYKTKRYFNTHATPHLSRRMKVKTGLELLETGGAKHIDYDAEIQQVSQRIKSVENDGTRPELLEEKDMLVWKKIKSLRECNWLSLDEFLSTEDLTDEVAEKRRLEQEAKEAKEKEAKEINNLDKDDEIKAVEDKAEQSKEEDSRHEAEKKAEEHSVNTEEARSAEALNETVSKNDTLTSNGTTEDIDLDQEPASQGQLTSIVVESSSAVDAPFQETKSEETKSEEADRLCAEKESRHQNDELNSEKEMLTHATVSILPGSGETSSNVVAANDTEHQLQDQESETSTRKRRIEADEDVETRQKRVAANREV